MLLQETARLIVHGLVKPSSQLPEDVDFVLGLLRYAINDKLEDVAREIETLERGTYTTAQTPAGLVRAMKVK